MDSVFACTDYNTIKKVVVQQWQGSILLSPTSSKFAWCRVWKENVLGAIPSDSSPVQGKCNRNSCRHPCVSSKATGHNRPCPRFVGQWDPFLCVLAIVSILFSTWTRRRLFLHASNKNPSHFRSKFNSFGDFLQQKPQSHCGYPISAGGDLLEANGCF